MFQYSIKLLVTCTKMKVVGTTATLSFSIRKDYWSLVLLGALFAAMGIGFSIRKDYWSLLLEWNHGQSGGDQFQYSKKLLVTLDSFCNSPRRKINLRFTHYFDFNVKIAKASLTLSIQINYWSLVLKMLKHRSQEPWFQYSDKLLVTCTLKTKK